MDFRDIRDDLDENIEPFSDYEKRDISVCQNNGLSVNDIFSDGLDSVNLSKGSDISIDQHKKSYFKKKKHIDPIYKTRFKTDINISKPKGYHTQIIKENVSRISTNLDISKNNIKKSFQEGLNGSKKIFKKDTTKHSFSRTQLGDFTTKTSSDRNLFKLFTQVFIVFCIVLLGFKFTIQHSVNTGYSQLRDIKDGNIKVHQLHESLNNIYSSFVLADILFKPIGYIENKNIQNGYHIIKGGKYISKLGNNILSFTQGIENIILEKGIENIYISQIVSNSRDNFLEFEKLLTSTLVHYDKIEGLEDTNLEITFNNAVTKLHKTLGYIKTININFDEFLGLMGHDSARRYLIVFQNNDEIRPTGGFMGSMGVVTVFKGQLIDIQKSDVYAYEWEINKTYNSISEKIKAPKGLDKITGTWGLRDSNYYPEVKKSSQEIKGFMDRIENDIDGIIYINKSTIEELLRVTGEIEFSEIGETITADNFSRIISTLVEAKTFKVGTLGTPKQILFDFSEKFYQKVQSEKNYIPYVKVLLNHLNSRDIMIYSFHSDENSLLWKLGFNGDIGFHKTLDFAYPVFTSISGNKSDRYIKTSFTKNVEKLGECHYKTNLKITRNHIYSQQEEQEVNRLLDKFNVADKHHIRYIQGKGDNKQFMRVLLPKNAVIERKDGMVITDYKRYKMVDFYITTRLYEITDYDINYQINKPNCSGYSYTLYKQPGIKKYNMFFNMNGENITARDVKKDFFIKK